jgi:hypothetical protein
MIKWIVVGLCLDPLAPGIRCGRRRGHLGPHRVTLEWQDDLGAMVGQAAKTIKDGS